MVSWTVIKSKTLNSKGLQEGKSRSSCRFTEMLWLNQYIGFNLMNHFAVYQQRDAAECLELILHKVSQQVSEVSTYKVHTVIYQ